MDNGASSYRRFLAGQDEGLREIIDLYYDGLSLYLNTYLDNLTDAEDCAEEAMIVLATKKPHFSGNSSFKTWLYAVARNQARMFLRHRREIPSEIWEDAEPMADLGSFGDSPEKAMLADERNSQLWKALQSLNPDYSQVLYLAYFENMSPSEIGRIMKKTEKQVYNLSARAKTALKGKLEGTKYSWDI